MCHVVKLTCGFCSGVSAVESILQLDRLRQEVAVKELLAQASRLATQQAMRKTASVSVASYTT